ncbi:MAG: PLP-dependent aspartate aminotransferase family protein [Gemmatimonadota bacterium]
MTDFATRAVHGDGRETEAASPHTTPIHQSSSFTFSSVADGVAAFQGSGAYTYTRKANPTTRALERHISVLEAVPVETPRGPRPVPGDVDTRFFTSGMAAISATVLGIAGGGRVICQGGIYGTTESMVGGLDRFGVDVEFVRVGDLNELRHLAETGAPPALVYLETPANPLMQVTDIAEAAAIAHGVGARLAVDSTFATPALQRPLAWGADVVLHSTTKFMAGHGVVLGGSATGSADLVKEVIDPMRSMFGGSADPFAAWLTLTGLKTLAIRMERNARNADIVADFLRGHPRVTRVFRPDLAALPEGQMVAGGPMLSFEVEGGREAALTVIDRLDLVTLAPTLGDVDTLVQHPWSMSHVVLPEERRIEMGIGPGVLRVSVGIEAADDIVADFERALTI